MNEKEIRYAILEPFLKKKKKLKEIEKESKISYATLKRWVSNYKKNGKDGLKNKEREDKNCFKSVDLDAINFIKKIYEKHHNLPVTKIYDKAKLKLESKNGLISYPTFFRIINNLDENIKKNAMKNIKKEKIYEHGIIVTEVYLPYFNNKNEVYYLTLYYNKENFEVINFIFEKSKRDIKKLFSFFRKSIIMCDETPKYISLDLKISITKNLIRTIFFQSGIDIISEEADSNMKEDLKYLNLDILKEFENKKPASDKEIEEFLKKYFFIKSDEILEKNSNKYLYFLEKYKRKVHSNMVRLKNKNYKLDTLKKYEDEIVDIYYDEFNDKIVEIYIEEKYIGKGERVDD